MLGLPWSGNLRVTEGLQFLGREWLCQGNCRMEQPHPSEVVKKCPSPVAPIRFDWY
jgi:hypothetical protein